MTWVILSRKKEKKERKNCKKSTDFVMRSQRFTSTKAQSDVWNATNNARREQGGSVFLFDADRITNAHMMCKSSNHFFFFFFVLFLISR